MIRVGFTIIGGKSSWMGGINYLKNLLYAIKQADDVQIQPILFVGTKVNQKLVKEFEDLAIIIKHPVFDRYNYKWFIDILFRDVFKRNPIINKLILKNEIDIMSHSFIYGVDLKCKSINWIPDFQHLRLPHMFSKLNLFVRNYRLTKMSSHSDRIMLSSYDAFNDYKKFTPKNIEKASVIHFVSQTTVFDILPISYLESKYNFKGRYFFLPNQFWAHKNHKIAFEAIKISMVESPEILLLCSGLLMDNRNEKYINSIKDFISDNKLEKNIRFLGLIPYEDVKLLMVHCNAVVNPSYFEGWSSSVEESKSMGKEMILSNIPVHHEQAGSIADFFDYDDALSLSKLLLKNQNNDLKINISKNDLSTRTKEFGNQYQNLVKDVYIP